MSDKARLVMEAQVDAMTETLGDVNMRVSRMENALLGGSRQGLCTSVSLLQGRVYLVEKFITDLKYLRLWVSVGVVVLLCSVSWATLEWVMGRAQ